MRPLWSAVGTLTGVAGSLLFPRLLSAAGNFGAGEGALRALSAIGEVVLDDLVHNCLVRLDAENSFAQFDFSDLLAGHVDYVGFRHL
ncbi:hypothetical protein SDC9_184634 [bioreactor metagenome]|uniref:Uncharacterized protein n=1 Tax=bioreactor metagenome TaxID=1076179 RepID=A0A645HDK4_9ZZZZ